MTATAAVHWRAAKLFAPDVRTQLRVLFRSPRVDLVAMVVNAGLVIGGWFVLPAGVRDWLFEIHGPLAFAVVLETWMMGDATTTNAVALHATRLRPMLEDPIRLQRFFRAHAAAKAIMVGSFCAAVALIIGFSIHRYVGAVMFAAAVFAIPFAIYPLAACLGILFPFHPRDLRWRWRNRSPYRRTVRWLVLRFVPYTVVAALIGVLLSPALVLGRSIGHDARGRLGSIGISLGALVICALSVLLALSGSAVASRLTVRRAEALAAYLDDPERG